MCVARALALRNFVWDLRACKLVFEDVGMLLVMMIATKQRDSNTKVTTDDDNDDHDTDPDRKRQLQRPCRELPLVRRHR